MRHQLSVCSGSKVVPEGRTPRGLYTLVSNSCELSCMLKTAYMTDARFLDLKVQQY